MEANRPRIQNQRPQKPILGCSKSFESDIYRAVEENFYAILRFHLSYEHTQSVIPLCQFIVCLQAI